MPRRRVRVAGSPTPCRRCGSPTPGHGKASDATLDFAVTLAPAASDLVAVHYATEDGTATAGTDYEAASGQLALQAGPDADDHIGGAPRR